MHFKLAPDVDISETSWVADVQIAPVDLVKAFGAPPNRWDAYKVSGRYTFVEGEQVFTVYDWKATSNWDRDLPQPLTFWNSRHRQTFSIGSNCENADDFRAWLLQRIMES